MFRKVTPAAIVFAAVPFKAGVESAPDRVSNRELDEFAHYKCKPSDLPLYAPLHLQNKRKTSEHLPKKSALNEGLENGVGIIRTQVQSTFSAVAKQKQVIEDFVDTAQAHLQSSIDYLNQPHNVLPRSGAIAIGGFSGFIFAARGGFIKKVLYTAIGAGTIASLCYPRQAEQFARDTLYEARKGYAITYNFVNGVKPGEEIPVEPLKKFPTSLEDLKFIVWDLYDEAKNAIFDKKQ